MNRIGNQLITTLLLITICSFSKAVPYVSPVNFMEIPISDETMVINGIDDEGCWSAPMGISLFNTSGWSGTSDFSAWFKLCWDVDYLYFYADITDEYNHSYQSGYADIWMFDCIEFYLDLDTVNHPSTAYDDNTIQLRFNRGMDAPTLAGRADAGDFLYQYEEKAGGDGWILEVGIPWTCAMPEGSLPEDINDYVSTAMGLDVNFADSDNADGDYTVGNRDSHGAWDEDGLDGTEDQAWINTTVFGIVELMTEPPAPAIPYTEPVRTMNIPARTDAILFDGIDNEESWSASQNISLFNTSGYSGANDFDASFKLAWDRDYLFFFADITDDVAHYYSEDYINPWMFDNIEFFLDLDTVMGTTDYDNNAIQLRFDRGLDHVETPGRADATDFMYYWEDKSGGDGWIVEAAIPWTCVMPEGYDPEDFVYYMNKSMGLDVNFGDSDNSDGVPAVGNRDVQGAWDADGLDGTEDLAWNNTHVFGIVDLIGEPDGSNPQPQSLPYYQPVWEIDVPVAGQEFDANSEDDEDYWSYPQELQVFNEGNYWGNEDLAGSFRTAWDYEYLYLYADITDDTDNSWISGGAEGPELFDNLEVYLDLDTFCLDRAYRSNSTAMLRFSRGMSEVQEPGRAESSDFRYSARNKDNGQGWIVEVAIPWTAALEEGSVSSDIEDYLPTIGFDVMLTDRDDETNPSALDLTLAAWDPDDEGVSDPFAFMATVDTRAFGLANMSPYQVSLAPEKILSDIMLYPNPTTDRIYLENIPEKARIEIRTIDGRLMRILKNPSGTSEWDVSGLRSGLYLLCIIPEQGSTRILKLLME